jgi:hypothetical protein
LPRAFWELDLRSLFESGLGGGRLLHGDRCGAAGEIHLLDRPARFVARCLGLVADVRLGRGGGDVGRLRGRRRQRLPAPGAHDQPAERADHDHGDDYSKDDGFHNPSSISHG